MPVLEELIARAQAYFGEGLKDIVVLHVNHCMDNSFYFSELLNQLFFFYQPCNLLCKRQP